MRVLIVGPARSGKTLLATKIAALLVAPVVQDDTPPRAAIHSGGDTVVVAQSPRDVQKSERLGMDIILTHAPGPDAKFRFRAEIRGEAPGQAKARALMESLHNAGADLVER